LIDPIMSGQESLRLPKRPEPLHIRSRRRIGWWKFSASGTNFAYQRPDAPNLRAAARKAKNAGQARRLLALAAIYDR
jgi:hypothetical protein